MFLLRMLFWLSVVIILVPSQGDEPQMAASGADHKLSVDGAFDAVTATVSDMGQFCERNRDACETGSIAFDAFLAKAENAARMAYRMAAGARGVEPVDEPRAEAGVRDAGYSVPGTTSGTLNSRDLEPAWRGPGDAHI